MRIKLPLNYEEVMSQDYKGERLKGNRYEPKESLKIADWMIKGLQKDGKGRNPVRSGCSLENVKEDLNAMYSPEFYFDKKGNNRRSKSAIQAQVTKLALSEEAIKLLAYYERKAPPTISTKGELIYRAVYNDVLKVKQILKDRGISVLTTGEYDKFPLNSSVIIREELTQDEIDNLDALVQEYPFITLDFRTREQYEKQMEKWKNSISSETSE